MQEIILNFNMGNIYNISYVILFGNFIVAVYCNIQLKNTNRDVVITLNDKQTDT